MRYLLFMHNSRRSVTLHVPADWTRGPAGLQALRLTLSDEYASTLTLRPLDWPATTVQLELEGHWTQSPAELELDLHPAIARAFLEWPEGTAAPFKPGTHSAARMPGKEEA